MRSVSGIFKLPERGEKANGGKAKYLTLWSADVKDTVVNWNSTTVYTIPKNTDMVNILLFRHLLFRLFQALIGQINCDF